LRSANGKIVQLPVYALVDEEEEGSKHVVLKNVPPGKYTSMDFTIGVDSLHNCSGAQSGALDPANAMFWTWNTGYIFLKLEGKSEASTAPGNIFEYHIGGYRFPYNCIRRISVPLTQAFEIKNGTENHIEIQVNAAEILKSPESIDFSKLPSVTDPKNGSKIADNYIDMFSLRTSDKNQ
jgi:hypothetical protein